MSFLAEVIRCIAKNHLVSGVFDLWKIVPALAAVCSRQSEHWKWRRAGDQLWRTLPQCGHTKPSGQRPVPWIGSQADCPFYWSLTRLRSQKRWALIISTEVVRCR